MSPRLRPGSRPPALAVRAGGGLRAFRRSEAGALAVMGAFAIPVVLVLAVGAIEMQQVWSDKHRTQDVADAAALEGAQQLAVTQNGATSRAEAFARDQLADLAGRSDITVTATMISPGVMKVAIDTHRMSFFANLLPPGGFKTHAEATAKSEAMAPLCVLTIGASGAPDDLNITATSKLEAPACMSHANHNITVAGGAALTASASEAVGTASGPITPAANTGAPSIPDPFASLSLTAPTTCNVEVTSITAGILPLQPGLHCSAVNISKTGTLQLAAGTHYFSGNLHLQDNAVLDGTAGVTMVFTGSGQFQADPNTTANLKGAKSGPLAGFVIATDRNYNNDFHLPSGNITQITGTVYIPAAKLMVDGGKKAGQSSPWTVVAAKGMAVNGGTDLVINADYASSDVPVPVGVGTKIGNTRITH